MNYKHLGAALTAFLVGFLILTLHYPLLSGAAAGYAIPVFALGLIASNTAKKQQVLNRELEARKEKRREPVILCPVCRSPAAGSLVYCSDGCRDKSALPLPAAAVPVTGVSLRYVNGEYVEGEYVNGGYVDDSSHGLSEQDLAEYRQRQDDLPAELVADRALEGYVPKGRDELLAALSRHLKDLVAAAVLADRETSSVRPGHWELHPQWVPDLRLLKWDGQALYGYPVKVDSAYGLPQLVLGLARPNPEKKQFPVPPAEQLSEIAGKIAAASAQYYGIAQNLHREREVPPDSYRESWGLKGKRA